MPRKYQDSLNQAQVAALNEFWREEMNTDNDVLDSAAVAYTHGFVAGSLHQSYGHNFPEDDNASAEYRQNWVLGYSAGYELTEIEPEEHE